MPWPARVWQKSRPIWRATPRAASGGRPSMLQDVMKGRLWGSADARAPRAPGGRGPAARAGAAAVGAEPVESPSGPPSWEPLDGDHSGVGERLELRVSRHHDTPVVLRGDDGEGIGIR